ncbi:MAG: class II glutamine amidotransferase, partial [Candidatus Cloacimonadaceae bacterium]|nr:class II glutamine amidotransferase [Candidatus Cloacimonadaceae bacterium]
DFPAQGSPVQYQAYNDPWDYFAFVMANSNPHTNEDGYGVVAYGDGNPLLVERGMWYKRVRAAQDFGNVYYTGNHLAHSLTDIAWNRDILDNAMLHVKSGEDAPAIVMCHARNASGYTYGNHPFWFHHRDRTYTFMHNGNANAARSYMINRIHQMHPENNWFVQHPSNHFEQTNPFLWVDTEVMFHYLMAHIIANRDDVVTGLNVALAGIRQYVENPYSGVYNFIMSDGEKLYVFRSTPTSGANSHYRLSYKSIPGRFYAVRTLTPQLGDTELMPLELVVLSRDDPPRHIARMTRTDLQSADPGETILITHQKIPEIIPGIVISPNPAREKATMRIKVSTPGLLETMIYNIKGEKVWQSSREVSLPGTSTIVWDTRDERGRKMPSGIYLIRSRSGNDVVKGRIILLR